MPQAAPITLLDAKTTPVSHVFQPSKVSDLTATFFGPGQTLAGRETLTIERREASANVAGRAAYTLRSPVEVTKDGVVSVDHQSQIGITAISAPASTKAERADLWAMAKSLFDNPIAKAAYVDGEGAY